MRTDAANETEMSCGSGGLGKACPGVAATRRSGSSEFRSALIAKFRSQIWEPIGGRMPTPDSCSPSRDSGLTNWDSGHGFYGFNSEMKLTKTVQTISKHSRSVGAVAALNT